MNRKVLYFMVVALLIGVFGVMLTYGETVDFSGDLVLSDAKGKITSGKIFIKAGQKIRQEVAADGMTSVTILRLDKMISWTLLPNKQYMEMKIPANPNGPVNTQYEQISLGTQTINGYVCQGTQYKYKDKSLGTSSIWVANRLGYGIKMETRDSANKLTSTFEVKNLKEGAQPDALFEIPAGYTKMSFSF